MSETKAKYATKRLIHVTKEQEERMAQATVAKIQAFVNELNQIQSRRFELASALLIAHVTKNGLSGGIGETVEAARVTASALVEADAQQKFTDLKALFVELDVKPPQAALEWAAAKVGVTLFDVLPEEPAPLIVAPTTEDLAKVLQ